MPIDVSIRWADVEDYAKLGRVMFDAVRNGPSAYTEAQRAAWVPEPRSGQVWDQRLASQAVIAAEGSGSLLGFMSLAENVYLDFAYIRPSARGRGLFRQLLSKLEERARAQNVDCLWSHVSLNAVEAFAAAGFTIRKQETVTIGSESLDRFEMEKLT